MTYELKSCPFCAKPLTVRNGVNPYGRCDTEGCWMAEAKIGISCDDPKQVERWNTRPAPAATDTGLETVAENLARTIWGYFKGGPDAIAWFDNNKSLGGPAWLIEQCRSQAEALLAAETKLKLHWKDEAERFRIEFEKAAYDYLLTKARAEHAEAKLATTKLDCDLLDALQHQSWDLRCFDIPTGGDDADIGWRIVGHWQAKPHERTIAEVYNDDPRAAIRAAIEVKS